MDAALLSLFTRGPAVAPDSWPAVALWAPGLGGLGLALAAGGHWPRLQQYARALRRWWPQLLARLRPQTCAPPFAPASPGPEASQASLEEDFPLETLRRSLLADSADTAAWQGVQALLARASPETLPAAFGLLPLLPPARQHELLRTCLRSPVVALRQAASQAAATVSTPETVALLLELLPDPVARKAAAAALVALGDAALPALETALRHTTNGPRLRRLATLCARMGTPASRGLLLALAQQPHLARRAAALHALGQANAIVADAPLFQHLLQKELRLAQVLLHALPPTDEELRACLTYEVTQIRQRVFGLLLQLYERPALRAAQRQLARGVGAATAAAALAPLECLLPRPLYQALYALTEAGPPPQQVQFLDQLLGPPAQEPLIPLLLQRGPDVFAPWTLCVALRQWHPAPATVLLLAPYLRASQALLRETAAAVLQDLPTRYPTAYARWQEITAAPATSPSTPDTLTQTARLQLLRRTALFAQTPANALSALLPILREVHLPAHQELFAQGSPGTALFLVVSGEVGIYQGAQPLAAFRTGDFFGELALLDAEPRSATARAHTATVLLRLEQAEFFDVLEECPEVLTAVLRVLCQRLRRQNEKQLTTSALAP